MAAGNTYPEITALDDDTKIFVWDDNESGTGGNGNFTQLTKAGFDASVAANSAVTANTAKTGITTAQADEITANTAKVTYPSADSTKLAGIETAATADQTGAEIKTAYENESNTNAYTDAEKVIVGNTSGTNTGDQVVPVSGVDFDPVGTDNSTNELSTDQLAAINDSASPSASNVFATMADAITAEQALIIEEADELNTANGFDLTDIPTTGTVTWDDSTRKFTISPTSGETEFHYWIGGTKYTKTAAMTQAVAIPDVTGTYYAELSDTNLNSIGEITAISQDAITQEVFYENAIVGLVYWNATLGIGTPFREQHGHRMDSADHEMEHNTIGARYASGFKITGLVDAQDTFTGVESGKFYDEDIAHNISAATTIPFMYRLGSGDGEWTWSTADNKVGFFNGGANATWNEDTGTTWQLTQANSAHDFILHFVVATATLDGYDNFAKIIDQEGYSSRSNARDAIEGAKKKLILDGLPSPELCFLGVYICRKNGELENLSDGSVYLDLRGSSSRGSGGDSAASNKAADIIIDDDGSLITATNVEDALQENRTAIDLNTTHSESAHAPAGAEVNVNADWDSSSGDAEILNKPATISSSQATAITANTAKTGVTDEISNVVEDTSPQLGGSLDLNNKALTNEYTAGEALSARTLCYLKDDGKMWKADADAEATTQGMLALCTETASANDTDITFVITGRLTGYTGLTVGGICYVSGSAGAITQTRPTSGFVRVVGYADSATSIVFQPSPVWVEI